MYQASIRGRRGTYDLTNEQEQALLRALDEYERKCWAKYQELGEPARDAYLVARDLEARVLEILQ